MNDYTTFFNPELESILQEIARDPKAKLLKVPSSGQLICATHDSRVSIAAPGLTSAEVELLEVHREELGELLRQGCLTELYAGPDAETRLHRSVDANRRLEIRDEASWLAETEQILKRCIADDKSQVAVDVLSRCVRNEARAVTVAQLATAMTMATSSDQPYIYMAIDALESHRYSDARKLYANALSRGLSTLLESYCYEGLAVANWELGRPSEALDSIQMAVKVAGNRPMPLVNSIIIAARLGRFRMAENACKALDGLECTDGSARNFIPSRAGDREEVLAKIPLTSEVKHGVAILSETVGEMSKEVLSAVVK